jgi:hypothetical protein
MQIYWYSIDMELWSQSYIFVSYINYGLISSYISYFILYIALHSEKIYIE